jgi:hypothetical protein
MLEIRLPITSVATGIDGLAQLREGGILNWLMGGYLNKEREKTAIARGRESRFFAPKAAEYGMPPKLFSFQRPRSFQGSMLALLSRSDAISFCFSERNDKSYSRVLVMLSRS